MEVGVTFHATVVTPKGIVTCGGLATYQDANRKDCFRLTTEATWELLPSMNKARAEFDMVVLGDDIVAFGGSSYEDSYEKINWRNGEKWEMTKLRQKFYDPCVTKWNEESIFITGGSQSLVSNTSFKSSQFQSSLNFPVFQY